jgi:hypothetical protein
VSTLDLDGPDTDHVIVAVGCSVFPLRFCHSPIVAGAVGRRQMSPARFTRTCLRPPVGGPSVANSG